MLGDSIEGEARTVATAHAERALALAAERRRAVILSGGELTVTVRGQGRGGPNQEYALALALALNGAPGIAALAGDTDGTDGGAGSPDDPAGPAVDPGTLARAARSASIPPPFLPTTIPRASSPGWAISSAPDRPVQTSMTFAPLSLTGLKASRDTASGA